MSDKQIKRIPKEEIEKRERQQRRAKIFLVKALIEDLPPQDARMAKELLEQKAA